MKRVYKRVSEDKYFRFIGKLFCQKETKLLKINESYFSEVEDIYFVTPGQRCEKIAYIKNCDWIGEEDKHYVLKELL